MKRSTLIAIIVLVLMAISSYNYAIINNNFIGEWIYRDANFDLQINIYQEGGLKGYYMVMSKENHFMDYGDEKFSNLTILKQNREGLDIKLKSNYSSAVYLATLKQIKPNELKFILGDKIRGGELFFNKEFILERLK